MRWTLPLLLALAPLASTQAAPFNDFGFVLLSGKDRGTGTVNGNGSDWSRAKAQRRGNEPLLYVREGSAAYVIRDPATLARAEEIMKPQQELGARQGALGSRQGELGRQQGALGEQQARLGQQLADARLRDAGALGAQMGELGRRQSELGARQAELGRQQAELGRQQARLAQLARPKFQALVADAIRRGLAQRVD
jgi:hypothetical protein